MPHYLILLRSKFAAARQRFFQVGCDGGINDERAADGIDDRYDRMESVPSAGWSLVP